MKNKIILVILMMLGMLIPSNVIKAEGNTVRILFTNNLRDSLETFRTIDENAKEKTIYGYATMANAIANLKDENTILLDTGDFSLGTIFGCLAEKNAVDLSMMKSFGYDAVLLGNEDFDLGVEGLSTMLSRVEEGPTILLTNNAGYDFQDGIYLDGLNADETKAYSIIEKAGKRIAILGVSERRNKEDKVFSDPQKALKKSLEVIKKEN
ncbi:MAG: hypothetical protein IJ875_00960, partial [Solobacterium sp.]|nr:hypothetical protein [Solobacterium sp.]